MKLPSYFTLIKVNEICCDCQLVFTFLLFNQLIAAAELTEWMIFWFLCTSMSCVILTDIHWALKGCSEFSLIFFFFWSQWDFSIEFQGSWIKPALRASLNTTAAVCDFSPSLFLNLFSLHGGALLWFSHGPFLYLQAIADAETTLRAMPSLQKWLGVSRGMQYRHPSIALLAGSSRQVRRQHPGCLPEPVK